MPPDSNSTARHWLCALLLCASPLRSHAVDFDFSGSLRLRQETLDGQFRPGMARRDDLFSSRVVLTGRWSEGPWSLLAELQDGRALGGEKGGVLTSGEVNALEPARLHLQRELVQPLGADSTGAIRLGRFDLNPGSRRLVSSGEFRNASTYYTGLQAEASRKDGSSLNLFFVLPQQRLPDDRLGLQRAAVQWDRESPDTRLWGAVAARGGLAHGLVAEVAYLGFREQDSAAVATRDRSLANFSARLHRPPRAGTWDYELEGIVQSGRTRSGTAPDAPWLDVAAGFLHAELARSFTNDWKSRLALEYDFASGDGNGARYGRFDPLYGMRRSELGPTAIFAAVGRTNLETLALRLEVAPSPRLDAFTLVRAMWAPSPTDSFSVTGVRDASGRAGHFAGYLMEARMRYWLWPERLRAEFTGASLLKGRLLEQAPNAPPWGNTLYVSGSVTLHF